MSTHRDNPKGNTIVRMMVPEKRGQRMTHDEAVAWLKTNSFQGGRVIRHSVSKDGCRETIVTEYERTGKREDGSPFYYRARTTEECAR